MGMRPVARMSGGSSAISAVIDLITILSALGFFIWGLTIAGSNYDNQPEFNRGILYLVGAGFVLTGISARRL